MSGGLHIKGRGATISPAGRFESRHVEALDDGWPGLRPAAGDGGEHERQEDWPDEARPPTVVLPEAARSIISRNQSPDVPFDRSINPYRGCEHGCVYCFARPSHGYVNLSPGIDFETQIFYKENAAQLLEKALAARGYRCAPIAMGTNTDPYQPAENERRVTRSILEVMVRFRHPVTIVTKSALILRDLDLLADLARDRLVSVALSVTTLDNDLKRKLEPRTASGRARLSTVSRLAAAGVPTGVMVAPVIPCINDHELETILAAARDAGARRAAYILLRLPGEVKELFRDWLAVHYPDRAAHVMSLVQQSRGGRDYDPRFGHRMRGEGPFAQLLQARFARACRQLGLATQERSALAVHHFGVPRPQGPQLSLL